MKTITVWTGPVNAAQNGNLSWPRSTVTYITCTGDQKDGGACHELAAKRPLASVIGDADEVYLAAFSAGGQLVKRWMLAGGPAAERVRGIYLADGTFADWQGADQRTGRPDMTLNRGLVEFVARAAKDPSYRAVFTASANPGAAGAPTGSQVLSSIRDAAQVRFRQAAIPEQGCFATVDEACVPLPPGTAPKGTLWTAGGAALADLGLSISHEAHPTKLARYLWGPLFVRPTQTAEPAASRVWVGIATAAGAALAAVGAAAAWRAKRARERP